MSARSLSIAAVQLQCEVGRATDNLARAGALVEQAASRGAQVVVLPELTPGGYVLTEVLWTTAEPFDGPTVAWLRHTARRFSLHLGTSFLEADGANFYNTFVLATPQGEVAGRVRKNPPASAEAYFFRAGDDRHVIDTVLGRIGIGICYEALLHERIAECHQGSVDLLLLPMSAGTPMPVFPLRQRDADAFDRMIGRLAAHHAGVLGVPVGMANKCGPLVTALPGGMPTQRTRFPGLSTVADSDGSVKTQLGSEPGIALAQVQLDPGRKAAAVPQAHGRWALEVPWFSFLFPLAAAMGRRAYARSRERAARALALARED